MSSNNLIINYISYNNFLENSNFYFKNNLIKKLNDIIKTPEQKKIKIDLDRFIKEFDSGYRVINKYVNNIATLLCNNTTIIYMETFILKLYEQFEKAIDKMYTDLVDNNNSIYIFTDSIDCEQNKSIKSNYWLASIFVNYLNNITIENYIINENTQKKILEILKKKDNIFFYYIIIPESHINKKEDLKEYLEKQKKFCDEGNYKRLIPDNTIIYKFYYFDDCIYSGTQMKLNINYISSIFNFNYNINIYVPYISKKGDNVINETLQSCIAKGIKACIENEITKVTDITIKTLIDENLKIKHGRRYEHNQEVLKLLNIDNINNRINILINYSEILENIGNKKMLSGDFLIDELYKNDLIFYSNTILNNKQKMSPLVILSLVKNFFYISVDHIPIIFEHKIADNLSIPHYAYNYLPNKLIFIDGAKYNNIHTGTVENNNLISIFKLQYAEFTNYKKENIKSYMSDKEINKIIENDKIIISNNIYYEPIQKILITTRIPLTNSFYKYIGNNYMYGIQNVDLPSNYYTKLRLKSGGYTDDDNELETYDIQVKDIIPIMEDTNTFINNKTIKNIGLLTNCQDNRFNTEDGNINFIAFQHDSNNKTICTPTKYKNPDYYKQKYIKYKLKYMSLKNQD